MYRLYYTSTKPVHPTAVPAVEKSFTGSLGDLRGWARRKVLEDAIWDDWAIYNEAAGHLVCAGKLNYNSSQLEAATTMKPTAATATPLNRFHADVASVVGTAQESGPVLLVDDAGKPQGVVLGFDDMEDAQDWLLENSPEAQAAFADGYAAKAAGRVTPLADVRRELLGDDR